MRQEVQRTASEAQDADGTESILVWGTLPIFLRAGENPDEKISPDRQKERLFFLGWKRRRRRAVRSLLVERLPGEERREE